MANSWQSPTTGEPSLGTPHITNDTNRSATLVVNTTTNTAGTWSTGYVMTGVPTGAKAAWCMCYAFNPLYAHLAVEAATGYTLSDITAGNNLLKYIGKRVLSTGIGEYFLLKIHLDANGQFKWCCVNSNTAVLIGSAIDYEM